MLAAKEAEPPPAPPAGKPCERQFVHSGQVAVSGGATWLVTILGSCVSVCVWDSRRRGGGMNHFALPYAPLALPRPPRPFTYGDVAVPELIDRMLASGSRLNALEAKVFGGAGMAGERGELGARNAELALALLAERGVHVVARDVGGRRGRKLLFSTADGTALVRQL
jgi:chemotaxis protein CheD